MGNIFNKDKDCFDKKRRGSKDSDRGPGASQNQKKSRTNDTDRAILDLKKSRDQLSRHKKSLEAQIVKDGEQ